ncbi:hypothetical protein FE257_010119 [Aspergillus nanangensis]|uniref:Cytochrome P450 n=1 Tax=Aspergillus nanangensis TaxID=2582783 RepID=A0AAD4CJ70_ASPNN|nr:hypothetical protein FE257_010119 [Aspergillus nanangensis]
MQGRYIDFLTASSDHLETVLWACILGLVASYVVTYVTSPLRKFPGPFFAGWTNLWRMYHVRQGKFEVVVHDLHKKYGPVVRIAPGVVDLDFPELVKTIYNSKGDYKKTGFYKASSAKANGKIIYNLFSECNPEEHARQKRPIAKHYSMAGVLRLEPHIDEMIACLCQRLEEKFFDGLTCDLDQWIRFYTWDVVGKATFSEPIGYLEKGHDFDKTIAISDTAMDYFAIVAQLPILDHFLDKNPVYRIGPPSFGNITTISIQHLMRRLQARAQDNYQCINHDFLEKFIDAKAQYPDVVDDGQIISYLMINMIAGADTTAIAIIAALYYSLKTPGVWKKLQQEIPAQVDSTTIHPFKSINESPYLNAVVREAMRLHPSVALTLERSVPAGGLTLPDGRYIPEGCAVGMNPYIVARNDTVWGDDPEVFNPGRWLRDASQESDTGYQERLRRMDNADLSFGDGSRVCIGKNLALIEIYKVIATLVSRYEVKLVYPDRDWKTHNSFFVRQSGLEVKLSRRCE